MFGSEIDAPLRGGPWIAIYDPLLKGGHRTAMYTLNGRVSIPGRFAIDFIAMPQTGAVPAERAPDANGFGAEVLAVADGTIAVAVDGVVDATPPPITLELAPGNHVAIDLGGNRFAFYEHLQRGSVRVKVGDRVSRGQVIAQLGSSGSSSIGPHLHFHMADAASTLAAEGVPFVFRQFTQVGRFASLTALISGEKWLPAVQRRDLSIGTARSGLRDSFPIALPYNASVRALILSARLRRRSVGNRGCTTGADPCSRRSSATLLRHDCTSARRGRLSRSGRRDLT